jgi:hypothetical protein
VKNASQKVTQAKKKNKKNKKTKTKREKEGKCLVGKVDAQASERESVQSAKQ